MKTYISLVLCLLLFNSIEAQIKNDTNLGKNSVAITTQKALEISDQFMSPSHDLAIKTTGTNANYLNLSNVLESPKYIRKLQILAAGYDIKTSEIYNSFHFGVIPIYQVTIKTNEGRITAHFNEKGEIEKTSERYTNVAIPTYMVIRILKDFPDWKITSQTCEIDYVVNKGSVRTYEVKLRKGKSKKTLDLDAKGNII